MVTSMIVGVSIISSAEARLIMVIQTHAQQQHLQTTMSNRKGGKALAPPQESRAKNLSAVEGRSETTPKGEWVRKFAPTGY